jgi:HPr kinase/phosphorylase
MEVRGLGVLNIRALFGETSVKPKKNIKLIVNLIKLSELKISSQDRLQIEELSQSILDVEIPKVRIPVAGGRNIAVMVEVAVRNHILRKRGINSTREFVERHERLMSSSE